MIYIVLIPEPYEQDIIYGIFDTIEPAKELLIKIKTLNSERDIEIVSYPLNEPMLKTIGVGDYSYYTSTMYEKRKQVL